MDTWVWVVLGAVLVVALVLLATWLLQRRAARTRARRVETAEGLRGEAASHTDDLVAASRRARQTQAEAEQARARADRAERVAAEARQDLAREEALREDLVRTADELDPRVDTAADDYRPITGEDMKGGAAS